MKGFTAQYMVSKVKIFCALRDLLQESQMDSIRVTEICRVADVGKTTFYSHFKDKYEIIQWYTDLAHNIGVGQIGRSLTWERGHRFTTRAILAQKSTLVAASHSQDYNSVNSYSVRWRQDNLIETITNYQNISPTREMTLQVSALAAAEIALIQKALDSNETYSLQEIVNAMLSIVPDNLYKALEHPVMSVDDDPSIRLARAEYSLLEASL